MVNAIRILSRFIAQLPEDRLSPETTEGREGFLHPYVLEGGVARAHASATAKSITVAKTNGFDRYRDIDRQSESVTRPACHQTKSQFAPGLTRLSTRDRAP